MNNKPNTTHHPVGALVIHDDDHKSDKMLQRVVGYSKQGYILTEYVDKSISLRVYENDIKYLHDPERPDVRARWKSSDGQPLMLLWVLRDPNAHGLDVMLGYVVRAESALSARRMAADADKFDRGGHWLDPDLTTCEALTGYGDAEVILSEYRYG